MTDLPTMTTIGAIDPVSGLTIAATPVVSLNASGGGGGEAVTIADGADIAQGSRADAAWVSGSGTVIGITKAIVGAVIAMSAKLPATLGIKTSATSLSVAPSSDSSFVTTVADGANVTQGAVADAAWSGTGNGTVVSVLKALWAQLTGVTIVGGTTARPSANFTRPSNTTAYVANQLVANSVTAGSVTAMTFTIGRLTNSGGMLRRLRMSKSGTSVTNAQFRLHLYASAPTASNGDGGAWLTNNVAGYVGSFTVTMDKVFTDGASGNGVPDVGSEINFTAQTYYGLIQVLAAYTPISAEVFTVVLEDIQN